MKTNRPRQIITAVILVLADILLFIALVKWLRWPLVEHVGFDIADYESRDEIVTGFRVYRFGAGCFEYLFLFIKAALLIFLERITYNKCRGSKVIFSVAVIIHIVLFLLCLVYVYRFLDGNNIFWLIRYFLTGAEPPF